MRPRPARASVAGALLATLALSIMLGVTTCNARRDGRRAERIAQVEALGYQAAKASLARRHVTDSVVALSITQANIVKQHVAANRNLGQRLAEILSRNDRLLSINPDSSDTDTLYVERLRVALARTTEVARLYRDSTEVLLGSVERALASQSAERQAWLAERAATTAELAAKDALIAALKDRECRVWFIPCPSRTQSAVVGFAVGVLTIAAVAR